MYLPQFQEICEKQGLNKPDDGHLLDVKTVR